MTPTELTYAVVTLRSFEVLERGLTREDADGYVFGFNSEAEANNNPTVRAAVILETDLPGESEVSHA